MKGLILFSFMMLIGTGCAKKISSVQPIAEVTTTILHITGCYDTAVVYLYFSKDGKIRNTQPTPRGCRCAVKINGMEYVPSMPGDRKDCDEQRDE